MTGKTLGPLTFGFDIGIASVGWCVLGENRIVDLGVRCFDKAETAKEGESLNLARRAARLMRRRLRRRAWRLTKLARLLKRDGLIQEPAHFHGPCVLAKSPWQLRLDGLDRQLGKDEWARVIYHLCKHRGFHWISRAEEKKAEGDAKGEGGRVKQGLAGTAKLMKERGYRSTAEMVLAEFPDAQRNKQGDYGKALSRILLGDELALLFRRQREWGNPHAGAELEAAILGNGDRKKGLFWAQKPPLSGADLLKMLGKCTFEKDEYRAPKASFTAERQVWLTRLNNLRIAVDGTTRPLNEEERRIALPLPYDYDTELTYKRLRTALKGRLNSFNFAGIPEDKEKDTLVKLPAWQQLRKALKSKGLETEWKSMAGAATGGNPELLDEIARVLSVFKDGDEVATELRRLNLPGGEAMVEALGEISFDKFHALSLKALRKIVPHMEAGLRHDEACAAAGYHHSQLHKAGEGGHRTLPPLYSGRDKDGRMVFSEEFDVPRNPVVLRALNQARKVLNALVRRYGSPAAVHVEMARDLSKPLVGHPTANGGYVEGRRDIEKLQKEYRERNEKDKAAFAAEFNMPAKSREFEKFQLYREQQGKCAYSLAPLDLDRVLHDIGYAEVDHALPYSRSFDDGKNNKVLVLAEENRNKGNRTPYEYLDGAGDSERWRQFVAFVESNKPYRLAKRTRLLRKDFGDKAAEEFRDRNLNDTRYICRFFKNYVERHLKLAEGSEARRCVVLSGQTTAFLRARWGLVKLRGESDRHHALDAAVVAACSHGMVKRLADYSRRKELEKVREGFADAETGEIVNPAMFQQLHEHFPDPWPNFRGELEARLNIDDPAELRAKMESLGTYPPEALHELRPLFISRAPKRRNGGAMHQETIRSAKMLDKGLSYVSVKLQDLKLADLDRMVGAFRLDCSGNPLRDDAGQPIPDKRNTAFVEALRERLRAYGGDGKKAFGQPFRKPSANGKQAPLVRAVKLLNTQKGGVKVRGGIADNASMWRVDVFEKAGKFYLVPIYQSERRKGGQLPNRAATAAKPRDQWTPIDESFAFRFSLCLNDVILLKNRESEYLGYFAGLGVATAGVSIMSHDNSAAVSPGKSWQGTWPNNGVKNGVVRFEKFHVDTLGNIYPAPPETRRGLA